ncbi:nitroreductase family protein, partial [Pseudoalteromonas piscicida]
MPRIYSVGIKTTHTLYKKRKAMQKHQRHPLT